MNDRPHIDADDVGRRLRAQGEMRQATAMMVDMVGSTEISETLGAEDSFLLLHDVLAIARRIVTAHGGTMMEELGDGFFAMFGAPVAIERASLAACRAGLEICAAVAAEARAFEGRFGLVPRLRVGLAAGEILVTGQIGDGTLRVTGNAVNLAARLQGLAEPNTVVCSGDVALEVGAQTRCEALGMQRVKGFAAAVAVYRVAGMSDADAPPVGRTINGADRFVGRVQELERLTRWASREAQDHPVCLVVGEAGIGKSRILAELAARFGAGRIILGACHPTSTARPLAPLVDVLRCAAEWRPGASVGALANALAPILPEDDGERAALLALLAGQSRLADGMDADAADALALRGSLARALTALAQEAESLVAIEDLHWIDPLSAGVLLDVVRAAPEGIRMLGTTRPVDWLDDLPADQILRLDAGPMRAEDIAAMAEALIGDVPDPQLVERITMTSEGNPFFATEILHNTIARGPEVEAGRIGVIQNVALARFDRLDPAVRALLRLAAVQGRTFRLDVLRRATGPVEAEAVDRLMAEAEGILEPDPSDPEGSARFRHILFRDSIYATAPSSSRGDLHRRTAQAIEACSEAAESPRPDMLADHYERAGEPVAAVKYLCLAARDAFALYALDSCKSLMERAFRLIEPDPDRFAASDLEEAVAILMRCLDVMDEFRLAITLSEIWLPRLRSAGGSPTQALLLALTAKAHCHMARFDQSLAVAAEALVMAERHSNERAAVYAKVVKMRALSDSGRGRLEEVERLFDETRTQTETMGDSALYANRMFHMMAAYRARGMMARALAVNDEIEAFAVSHKQIHVRLVADWNRALTAVESNDFATAQSLIGRGAEISVRNTAIWQVFKLLQLAMTLNLGGVVSLEEIEEIRARAERRGEFTTRNAAAIQLGFALLAAGRIREGWRQLGECEGLIRSSGHPEARRFFDLHRAEFLLVLAGLIEMPGETPKLALGDIAAAVGLRLRARRVARGLLTGLLAEFDVPEGLFVARAKAGLAVIAAADGKRDAAREGFVEAEALFRTQGLEAEIDRLSRLRTAAKL